MQSSANQPGELCIYTITSVRIDSIFAPLRQTPCTAGRKDKLRLLPLDRRCNSLLSIATLFLSLSQSRVHTHTHTPPTDRQPTAAHREWDTPFSRLRCRVGGQRTAGDWPASLPDLSAGWIGASPLLYKCRKSIHSFHIEPAEVGGTTKLNGMCWQATIPPFRYLILSLICGRISFFLC